MSVHGESLDTVPLPTLSIAAPRVTSCREPAADVDLPPRFMPRLAKTQLTFAQSFPFDDDAVTGAARFFDRNVVDAAPVIKLTNMGGDETAMWSPALDLLAAEALDRTFVVETEDDGAARMRFGDGVYGARPVGGTRFVADYRVGNGTAGNVGRGALQHIVLAAGEAADAIESIVNPLPAKGGVDPESMDQVRARAPYAFMRQERAVTPADYAAAVRELPHVQQAAATQRWTGSWHTNFIAVDTQGGKSVETVRDAAARRLDAYRMAGTDCELREPRLVPLEIELRVCVNAESFRVDIERELREVFGRGMRLNGTRGFFHPDALTFATPVYLSAIYAAALTVPGVERVRCTNFGRRKESGAESIGRGYIAVAPMEIPVLDNDPNYPDRGTFSLILEGGK